MNRSIQAAFLLAFAFVVSPLFATPATALTGVAVCDKDNPVNCTKPNADGSINVNPNISPTGLTPCLAGSSAGVCILKASAGVLFGSYITSGSTPLWLQIFNSATEPGDGATTASSASGGLQDCIIVPANQSVALAYNGPPEAFSVGIVLVASSTSCATKTKSTTAFLSGRAS